MAQHQRSSQTIAFTFHSTPNHRSNGLDPSQHTILYCHVSYISFTKYVHTDITSCKRPEITAHFMASTRIYSPNMLLQFYAPQPITTKTTTVGAFETSKDHYLLHSIHLQHLFTKHAPVVLHTSIATKKTLPWVHLQHPEITVHFHLQHIYLPNMLLYNLQVTVLHTSIAPQLEEDCLGCICNVQRPLFTSQHPLTTFIHQMYSYSFTHIHNPSPHRQLCL